MQNYSQKPRKKKWVIREETQGVNPARESALVEDIGVSPCMARLLCLRGYDTPSTARDFLYVQTEKLCDNALLSDIVPAADRLKKAIEQGEKITIYGDYDVDGVTAVSILYLYLRAHGADVDYYIPNRIGEGYGVSVPAVEALAAKGTKLIVTVDTGITASEEVERARELGVDFVITDHHECRAELPAAVAVVNPHRPDDAYPFKELAGVGVIFKVMCALEEEITHDPVIDCVRRMLETYADLVAIGTIADVMPICGENKIIVKLGLAMMEKTERPGLVALFRAVSGAQDDRAKAKKRGKISSGFIGYTIAPRINAAGRIRSASIAVELFLADTIEAALPYAEELCDANKERQEEENHIVREAYDMIASECDLDRDRVIILASDHWHHGIIGIVSSRITERYGLPSILVSFEGAEGEGDDAVGKGSGRSIKGMNLVDALVYSKDHLVKFGGHELAAGLSVTRRELPAFREAMNAYAREVLNEDALTPAMEADMVLRAPDITMEFAEELQILEPYGVGNPMPVFAMRDAELVECTPVSGGKHTRLLLAAGGKTFSAMCFSTSPSVLDLYAGDRVDILFTLDINEYNGRRSVQFIARDTRLAAAASERLAADQARYRRIFAGETYTDDDVFPTRDDFAAFYLMVKRHVRAGIDEMSHRAILTKLSASGIGYVKLKLMIRVCQELNLLGIDEIAEDFYHFHLYSFTSKIDLEKSNLLRRLRCQRRVTETV